MGGFCDVLSVSHGASLKKMCVSLGLATTTECTDAKGTLSICALLRSSFDLPSMWQHRPWGDCEGRRPGGEQHQCRIETHGFGASSLSA